MSRRFGTSFASFPRGSIFSAWFFAQAEREGQVNDVFVA